MLKDPWHYPRLGLARQILDMFESGLSHALVFFAPRRMGKTEFLLKDVKPYAEQKGWLVFYFSFLDVGSRAKEVFTQHLQDFSEQHKSVKKVLNRISKVSGEAIGIKGSIELNPKNDINESMKKYIQKLTNKGKILLLLDEVQALAKSNENSNFIASLRTVLDMHKDEIKVIFTGSSQDGLRRMFSKAKAPFFHFGQNLLFPLFDKNFTDHLVVIYKKVTKRLLDRDILWNVFKEMQSVPQLIRALVERLALNPELSLVDAKNQLLAEIFSDRSFVDNWENCSILERLLLLEIISEKHALFSQETRDRLAKEIGITDLSVPSTQSAVRVLQRKGLIGQQVDRGIYCIEDPNFKSWLLQNILYREIEVP